MSSKKEQMKDDIQSYAEIEAISKTKGGKTLVKSLKADTVSAVDALANQYKELSHIELIALCADLKTKLDIYRVLTRAQANKNYIQDLLDEEE